MLLHQRGSHFADPSLTVRLLTRRLDKFCQPEIENLSVPVACDHDVVRLQIAMHYSSRMSFRQSIRRMLQITQKLRQISLFFVNQLTQREAIDELHRDEVHAIALTNLVNVRDVRMVERGRGFRLLHKSPHAIAVTSEFGRE